MLLRQVIELFDLLDTPAANGTTVTNLFKERGNVEVTVENVKGDEGDTDCVTFSLKAAKENLSEAPLLPSESLDVLAGLVQDLK